MLIAARRNYGFKIGLLKTGELMLLPFSTPDLGTLMFQANTVQTFIMLITRVANSFLNFTNSIVASQMASNSNRKQCERHSFIV